jgi:hypothetical protein
MKAKKLKPLDMEKELQEWKRLWKKRDRRKLIQITLRAIPST